MLAASDTGTAIREWIVGVGPVIAAVVALYLGVHLRRPTPALSAELRARVRRLLAGEDDEK